MNYNRQIVFILLGYFLCQNPGLALPNGELPLRVKAYETIARDLYDNSVYTPMRIEIIDKLVKLSQKSETPYSKNLERGRLPNYKNLVKELTARFSNYEANQKRENPEDKVNKIFKNLEKDAPGSEAHILSQLIDHGDIVISTYAKRSLTDIHQESSIPQLQDMMKKKENRHVALVALVKIGAVNLILDELIASDPVKDQKYVEQLLSSLVMLKQEDLMKEQDQLRVVANQYMSSEVDNLKLYSSVLLVALNEESVIPQIASWVENENDTISGLMLNTGIAMIASTNTNTAAKLLLQLYGSANEKVKTAVLANIYRVDNLTFPRIKILEESLLSDNKQIAGSALISAVAIEDKVLSKNIYSCLKKWDLESVYISQYPPGNKSNLDIVVNILGSEDIKNKLKAAEILLELGSAEQKASAAETLKPILKDKSIEVGLVAAGILEKYGYKIQNDFLKEIIRNHEADGYDNYFINAVLMLAKSGDKEVVPILKDLISMTENNNLIIMASFLLLKLGDSSELDVIREYLAGEFDEEIPDKFYDKETFNILLNDHNEKVRLNSSVILSKLEVIKSKDILEKLLTSKDLTVRSRAASIIADIPVYNDTEKLEKLLDDPAVRVRINAAESIIRILNRAKSKSDS